MHKLLLIRRVGTLVVVVTNNRNASRVFGGGAPDIWMLRRWELWHSMRGLTDGQTCAFCEY